MLVLSAAVAVSPLAVAQPAAAGLQDVIGSVASLTRAAFTLLPEFALLPDSAGLTTPVMLHGRFTDQIGAPLSGARVMLSAWPSNETVHAMAIGGRFGLTPITHTVTGADGSYALRSLLTPVLAALVGRDGLDLQLDVFHAGRHYVYLTQVVPDTGIGGWVRASALDPLAKALSTGAHERNSLDVALNPTQGNPLSLDLLTADSPHKFRRVAAPGCTHYQKIDVKRALTTVATAAARNGVTIETTYTSEARTESSVGVSMDSGLTFAMSGGRSRTSGFGVTFKRETARRGEAINRDFRLRWQHTVVKRECARDFRGNYDTTYVTSPDEATGGGMPAPSTQPMWTCPAYRGGDGNTDDAVYLDAHTDEARAKVIRGAFGFQPIPGASFVGDAVSGYNKNVQVKFLFSKPAAGYWCGDTSYPTDKGQRVQAFQK